MPHLLNVFHAIGVIRDDLWFTFAGFSGIHENFVLWHVQPTGLLYRLELEPIGNNLRPLPTRRQASMSCCFQTCNNWLLTETFSNAMSNLQRFVVPAWGSRSPPTPIPTVKIVHGEEPSVGPWL